MKPYKVTSVIGRDFLHDIDMVQKVILDFYILYGYVTIARGNC